MTAIKVPFRQLCQDPRMVVVVDAVVKNVTLIIHLASLLFLAHISRLLSVDLTTPLSEITSTYFMSMRKQIEKSHTQSNLLICFQSVHFLSFRIVLHPPPTAAS